ncbi:MAG: hypothetical protein IKN43_02615 [Selenomonadaceae bacterium]|nr:hypothetical protein [Selenomonadaceae bacterium]
MAKKTVVLYFLSLSLFCKKEKEKESSKEREREKTLIIGFGAKPQKSGEYDGKEEIGRIAFRKRFGRESRTG